MTWGRAPSTAGDVGRGARVLDVAIEPGYVATGAAGRGARVITIDLSAAMVERARCRHPHVELRERDAETLAFEPSRFDAVVMNYGFLHLARPASSG